jgi:hypothetical protein
MRTIQKPIGKTVTVFKLASACFDEKYLNFPIILLPQNPQAKLKKHEKLNYNVNYPSYRKASRGLKNYFIYKKKNGVNEEKKKEKKNMASKEKNHCKVHTLVEILSFTDGAL